MSFTFETVPSAYQSIDSMSQVEISVEPTVSEYTALNNNSKNLSNYLHREIINKYAPGSQEEDYIKYTKAISYCLQKTSCPVNLRKCGEAQRSYEVKDTSDYDNQATRIKALGACTVGLPGVLGARIVRVTARVSCLAPAFFYGLYKGSRYNLKGECLDNMKRAGEEFVDLGTALVTVPISILKTFYPPVFSKSVETMEGYYIDREDRREVRREYVQSKIDEFKERQAEGIKRWKEIKAPQKSLDKIAES